jgi:alpha-tubulin suppressor-like RCC1 family protein
MKTKTILSTSLGRVALPSFLSAAAAVGAFAACSGEFKTQCPEGTVQQGGGDVDEACVAAGAGGTGGAGGASGTGGVGPGGAGGNSQPPPKGECQAGQKQCSAEGLSECGPDGQWQAPAACEIGCDGAKSECVVPVQLAAGSTHACALLSDGTVRCWGGNEEGQLGDGTQASSFKPKQVLNVSNATKLVADDRGTCAILADGTAWCWGANDASHGNRLDPSSDAPRFITPFKLPANAVSGIALSKVSLCLISDNSTVAQCQGDNIWGQLGNGSSTPSTRVPLGPVVGISGSPVDLSTSTGIVTSHSCAASGEGAVYCWGDGSYKQNGSAEAQGLLEATEVNHLELKNISQISTRNHHSCALRQNDGTILCWGWNVSGELGRITSEPVNEGSGPDFVTSMSGARQVSAGTTHVCAVKGDDTIWCWGNNGAGALGRSCSEIACQKNGFGIDISIEPVNVLLDPVAEVASGFAFTCARTKAGGMFCWGSNGDGQLGSGSVGEPTSTPQRVVWK